jgi:hypothetical protein
MNKYSSRDVFETDSEGLADVAVVNFDLNKKDVEEVKRHKAEIVNISSHSSSDGPLDDTSSESSGHIDCYVRPINYIKVKKTGDEINLKRHETSVNERAARKKLIDKSRK